MILIITACYTLLKNKVMNWIVSLSFNLFSQFQRIVMIFPNYLLSHDLCCVFFCCIDLKLGPVSISSIGQARAQGNL